jgi:hypothetical protein
MGIVVCKLSMKTTRYAYRQKPQSLPATGRPIPHSPSPKYIFVEEGEYR